MTLRSAADYAEKQYPWNNYRENVAILEDLHDPEDTIDREADRWTSEHDDMDRAYRRAVLETLAGSTRETRLDWRKRVACPYLTEDQREGLRRGMALVYKQRGRLDRRFQEEAYNDSEAVLAGAIVCLMRSKRLRHTAPLPRMVCSNCLRDSPYVWVRTDSVVSAGGIMNRLTIRKHCLRCDSHQYHKHYDPEIDGPMDIFEKQLDLVESERVQ